MAFLHDLYNTEDQSSYTVDLNLIQVRDRRVGLGFLSPFGP